MQQLDLQIYAFFTIILCGASLAFLYDLLQVARGHFHPRCWVGWLADVVFWFAATLTLFGGLFFANWAELRFYVVVGLLTGVGLYRWLARPVVMDLAHLVMGAVAWMLGLAVTVCDWLIWRPGAHSAGLFWDSVLILAGWAIALGQWFLRSWKRWFRR